MKMTEKQELKKYKEALQLAGKLANAAARVSFATPQNLSERVKRLDAAFDEYDTYIIAWHRESRP